MSTWTTSIPPDAAVRLAGEIHHFTGVSDPYEAPTSPEVLVRTDSETVEESLSRILAYLEARGLAAPGRAGEHES